LERVINPLPRKFKRLLLQTTIKKPRSGKLILQVVRDLIASETIAFLTHANPQDLSKSSETCQATRDNQGNERFRVDGKSSRHLLFTIPLSIMNVICFSRSDWAKELTIYLVSSWLESQDSSALRNYMKTVRSDGQGYYWVLLMEYKLIIRLIILDCIG